MQLKGFRVNFHPNLVIFFSSNKSYQNMCPFPTNSKIPLMKPHAWVLRPYFKIREQRIETDANFSRRHLICLIGYAFKYLNAFGFFSED
jgi:hypothetical protein